ncbi:MAG: choice-of-anchor D domain-containing protein [Spirochaetales bacterium]|nr:choice-of-anchor D domain-containing protein [Spirochaetales bacterium]
MDRMKHRPAAVAAAALATFMFAASCVQPLPLLDYVERKVEEAQAELYPTAVFKQGATTISSGGTITYPATIRTQTANLTFTIQNTGSANLSLGAPAVQIGGTNAANFTLTSAPANPVTPSGSTTFTLRFAPSAVQAYSATVTVNSNDPTYPAFTFNIAGSGTEWHGIATVDSANDVGKHAEIGVSGSSVFIAYQDTTNGDLVVQRSINAALGWSDRYTPDTDAAGYYNSMVIAGSNVFVCYQAMPSNYPRLKIARGTDGTSWGITNIDTTIGVGDHSSIAWDGSTRFIVGYSDGSSIHVAESADGWTGWSKDFSSFSRAGDEVAVAASPGATSGFGTGGYFIGSHSSSNLVVDNYNYNNEPIPWIAGNGDIGVNDQGTNIDAVMGSTSTVYFAYHDVTSANLKFVKTTRSYNSFSYSYVLSSTTPVTIDSTGDVGKYASIACSADGTTIYISYYDATNGNLKLAKSTNSGSTWSVQTVDSTGNVGQYSSVAVNGSVVYIAYYDVTNTALKVAKSLDGGATW